MRDAGEVANLSCKWLGTAAVARRMADHRRERGKRKAKGEGENGQLALVGTSQLARWMVFLPPERCVPASLSRLRTNSALLREAVSLQKSPGHTAVVDMDMEGREADWLTPERIFLCEEKPVWPAAQTCV